MNRPRAAFAMSADAAEALLTPQTLEAFGAACDLVTTAAVSDFDGLSDVELLITGWGCPPLDESILRQLPGLRAIVHTGGSVRGHITEACWRRGIEVSSVAAANAVPVAEYTVAMILLSGKDVLRRARAYRRTRRPDPWSTTPRQVGNYGKTVGILSASQIGRRVIELLAPYDVTVLLHDPYVSDAEAARLGARAVGLETLFAGSDIVSVHTPLLPATRGLVSGALLARMRQGAVLINTARGAVVDQQALTRVVREGRISAVLDVTDPEVLPPDHPLWDCDNVLITPHLAGSQGNEWQRLTALAAEEVVRWVSGRGFRHPVRRESLALRA